MSGSDVEPPAFAPPVFEEPWQAQAFALVVQLHAAGAFAWRDWSAALGAAIGADPAAPERYHEHWLTALEAVVATRGLATPADLAARKAAWARAYRDTLHGQPVTLS